MVPNDVKVRENRLRRKAARYGLHLSKSGRRDPDAPDFGRFALIDPRTGEAVHPALFGQFVHGWTLDDVEKHLLNAPAWVRQSVADPKRAKKRPPADDRQVLAADDRQRLLMWELLQDAGLVALDTPLPPRRKQGQE